MASAPAPITGLVDPGGRLVAADGPLARLQEDAGAHLGATLAVPQLAAIARLVLKLGVTVRRQAVAGTRDADLDLWVRAEPEQGSVRLIIERWAERPSQPSRWPDHVDEEQPEPAVEWFELDPLLAATAVSPEFATRLGQPAEQLAGAPLTRLVRLEAHEDGSFPLLAAITGRKGFSGQAARLPIEGEPEISFSGEPLEGDDGAFAGYRCQLDPPEEPAVQASTHAPPALDELLREPLDTIISEAQHIAAREEGPLRSDYAAYAGDIAAAAQHLVKVLRATGQDPEPGEEWIDLASLAAEAVSLVQPQATERGIEIVQDGPAELRVRGQTRAVTQILVNLIGNAVRYSPDWGVVQVSVRQDGAATITVADQGPGVADADRERIFERFEQAEPRGEGAGLGLAISRRLARSLGGDIRLDSREGEGARFTLTLPLP